jgi:hypothetical protein
VNATRVGQATAAIAVTALAAATAGLAAAPAVPLKANPCKGLKNCITVGGPWVAVPAQGEANFLLECPKRKGTVGGVDALASSQDVRMEWDAYLGAPLHSGTTTGSIVFFRAASAGGRPGLLQPYLGCVPTPPQNPRATTSARVVRVTRPGKPVDRWQTTVTLHAGHQTATRACGAKGERLLGGWQATAFRSADAPDPALAAKVHVSLTVGDGRVAVSIQTDAGISDAAFPEVQVGATCAK